MRATQVFDPGLLLWLRFANAAAVTAPAIARAKATFVVAAQGCLGTSTIVRALTTARVILAEASHDLGYQPHSLLLVPVRLVGCLRKLGWHRPAAVASAA